MNHERALQKALIGHLKADAAVQALLGDRIWDAAPEDPGFPNLTIGRSESRPVPAEGGGVEHAMTLRITSRFQGSEEAKAALAAVRARLDDAKLEADGLRTIALRVSFADVWPSAGGHRTFAVLRVRAVTEEI